MHMDSKTADSGLIMIVEFIESWRGKPAELEGNAIGNRVFNSIFFRDTDRLYSPKRS